MAAPQLSTTTFTPTSLDGSFGTDAYSAMSRTPFQLSPASSAPASAVASDLHTNPFACDPSLMAFQLDGDVAFASALQNGHLSAGKGQDLASKTLNEGQWDCLCLYRDAWLTSLRSYRLYEPPLRPLGRAVRSPFLLRLICLRFHFDHSQLHCATSPSSSRHQSTRPRPWTRVAARTRQSLLRVPRLAYVW